MGAVLDSQGKFPEALEVHNKALAIYLKIHGHMHPDVASTQDNIGLVLMQQGKFPEALEMHNKALKTRIEKFGPVHPQVADIQVS